MQTEILTGSGATATLTPGPYQGLQINCITLSFPSDEIGSADPSVTVSGAVTGAYTFHSSVDPNLRFTRDEAVVVTANAFTAEYSAIVKYVTFGDGSNYYNDLNRTQLPLPSRLTRNPRNGS